MLYLTGQQALNITCSLETCGDWHTSALQWERLYLVNSKDMFFGEYGIEINNKVPNFEGEIYVANHIRALLDLLEIGNFAVAQGMNKEYICNSKYDNEIFEKVYAMKVLDNWQSIDMFMEKEYLMKWIKYKKIMEVNNGFRLEKTAR